MNKIFRIVRDASGKWVVASEFAKGNRKSSGYILRMTSALAVSMLSVMPAIAATTDVTLGAFNPVDNDDKVGAAVVGDGDVVNLTGNANFVQGITGGEAMRISQLLADGRIVSGAEYADPNNPLSQELKLGSKTSVSFHDPVTGSNKSISIYESGSIVTNQVADLSVSSWSNVNDNQYIDLRVGSVDSSGGLLNVAIGDASKASTDNANKIVIVPKSTSLFHADGTGAAASTVEWSAAKTRIHFVGAVPPQDSGNSTVTLYDRAQYGNTFTAFDGSTHTVGNAEELKQYTDWLKQQVLAGNIASQKQYDDAYSQGVKIVSRDIVYSNTLSPTDEIMQPFGKVAVIHAVGAQATGRVAKDARIDAINVGSYGSTEKGGVMMAEANGMVINDGRISVANVGGGRISTAMHMLGGKGVNNGVINAGFLAADADPDSAQVLASNPYLGYAAVASGVGSEFSNTGIINLAGNNNVNSGMGAIAVNLGARSKGSNTGIINVGVSQHQAKAVMTGVAVDGASSFSNEGTIYIGRGPQYDAENPESVADVASSRSANGQGVFGVRAGGTGTVVENKGEIVIGSLIENANGIFANAGSTVTNSGSIQVKGAVGSSPLQNVGILVTATDKVSNTGTIDLLGLNGIGIKLAPSSATRTAATNVGTINVAGALDQASGMRNYGVWAEGAAAELVAAGGAINLSGDGAIGAHARDGGKISVNGGTMNFLAGDHQVGFFAYGKDADGIASRIAINTADILDVKTEGSVLVRIEDGASLSTAVGTRVVASGGGSTALQVTGVGSVANLDGMSIEVSGEGAVALKVEGGATGQMSGAANLMLRDGATAVVVDNVKYSLDGDATGAAQSRFTNNADVQVLDADDVTAFVVKNGAELINTGDIHLSHGTAIEIVGVGSTVKADGTGKRGTITVDDGVAGIHVHGGATLNTADTITVDKGAAGVLVGADAGRVVIEQGAHITGKGSSYGSLVVNRAAAGNTLINGATLEMQGSGAALLTESNLDAGSHGNILVSSNVGGKGIALSAADGGLTDGSLVVGDNWSIDVTGNGAGVYANTSGSLMVDSSRIHVSGPGNAIKADAAAHVAVREQAVITGTHADAQLIVGDMEQLQIAGTVQALDANAVAIALGAGDSVVSITGRIVGQSDLGAGDDAVMLEGAQVDGAILGGAGNDTFVLRGPQASTFSVLDGGIGADTDTLLLDSYVHVLDADNVDQLRNFERVELSNASTLDLRTAFALGDGGNGAGTLQVNGGSTLLAFNGPAQVGGNMANAGRVSLGNGAADNRLTVTGDYTGNGGIVELDTVLGSDDSASDKLVVQGSTHGSTGLKIHNVGGQGAYTTADGIQLVQVDGSSDGRFALTQRAVAGSHEYLLAQGGKSNPADGDWYLRSEAPPPPSCASGCEPGPGNPINPQPSEPESPAPVYRPEVAAYQGNQYAASGMFVHTLHDRLGEPDYSERQRDEDDRIAAGWVRVQGRQMDSRAGEQQLKMDTDSWVVQGGAELGRWSAGDSRFHAGVMVGTGKATSRAGSQVTGYSAIGRVQGSSVGVYGTWYQSAADRTGLYVDSWLQYGRYDNQVEGQTLAREDYSASNLTGSLEAGYALRLRESERSTLYLEPQAQVIFSDYNADDHEEANGTVVKSAEAGGLVTRLGARLYGFDTLEGRNRVQPFVEANWWHADRDNAVQLNRDLMTQALPQDRYEVKLGAQAELGGGWTGWGHLGYQQGQDDFQNLEGLIGVKRSW